MSRGRRLRNLVQMRISGRRCTWVVLASGGWAFFLMLWLLYTTQTPSYDLEWFEEGGDAPPTYRSLSENDPPPDSVMLLEGYNNSRLTSRMYCALESAARAHYPTPVIMFMTSKKLKETRLLENLTKELNNIQILHLNIDKLFNKSPLRDWYTKKKWEESDWPQAHFNDALRWLLLWYYGGVYLDLDVVVLRSLARLPNCTGLESGQWASAGVLKFTPAHPIITACLDHFATQFDGKVWGANGPKLLTRVLMKRCGLELPSGKVPGCKDIAVLSPRAFYPLAWWDWQLYMQDDPLLSDLLLQDPDVYVLHVWNLHSRQVPVRLHSEQPYARAANRFCPLTAAHSGPMM
ncbi:lactosylceramide 4-alpha-galactosyltransferase-like [Penaeus japonicus]|uniref:lactosylceramide 4-alpha-galactosyltransferase-like n=1 Tax=Penaeus japonicus TaxID=27405 RepID=UPI001C714A36|nr:lactosylceramide 4-alpha-galactosyltransferase-like [Penaeus japonicus]